MREAKRARVLNTFVDPAEHVVESAPARQLLTSDVGPDVLRLQLQSSLWFRPNLACSFRKETLSYLLEKRRRDPKPVLSDMLLSLEIRAQWRNAVFSYSEERIRSRLCNQNGPIRQQGRGVCAFLKIRDDLLRHLAALVPSYLGGDLLTDILQ